MLKVSLICPHVTAIFNAGTGKTTFCVHTKNCNIQEKTFVTIQ
jgi:hypothetical protein